MYTEYKDVFSTDPSEICKTRLVTMDIDIGDILPISQRPCPLQLKYSAWAQKELELLEKAGITVRSILSWASLIVVEPKMTTR